MSATMNYLKEMKMAAESERIEAEIKCSKVNEADMYLDASILATSMFKGDKDKEDLLKMFYELTDEKMRDAGVYKK